MWPYNIVTHATLYSFRYCTSKVSASTSVAIFKAKRILLFSMGRGSSLCPHDHIADTLALAIIVPLQVVLLIVYFVFMSVICVHVHFDVKYC